MNIKKIAYPAALVLLIIVFNLSMIPTIKNNQSMSPASIGILILLLALVVFRNQTFMLRGIKIQILAIGFGGVALTVINSYVAIAYAIVGLLLLTVTQLRIVFAGKPIWFLTGGDPLHKLDEKESRVASIGLTMMLSVALTFFMKVLWMMSNVK